MNGLPPSRQRLFALLIACAAVAAACSKHESTPGARSSASGLPAGAAAPAALAAVKQASRPSRPVIFLGLDGADWELLDRYASAGVMPNLARLVREGTAGTVETLHPPLSPIVWTTMMTGVDPLRHRILDFVRFNPSSGEKEPITSDERRAPAIWNMATWAGRTVGVFGLWATYPAEPVKGIIVSDRLFTFLFKEAESPEGVVFPRDQDAWARSVVTRVNQVVDLSELKRYIPSLTSAEYQAALASDDPYAHPVSALRRILIETRIYDELARDWIGRARPDLAIVYLQGTDSIGHTFAAYAPPRQPSIDRADYTQYHSVPDRYFGEIDLLIGRYRQMAEARGGVLMLASDHGFAWGDDRPSRLSSNAQATAAKWHRKEGIYLLWGPGIAARGHDATATGTVGQVCATLQALSGLPSAATDTAGALPGTPGAKSQAIDYAGLFQPPARPSGAQAQKRVDEDALRKLRSLGYVGESESATAKRSVDPTRTAGSYNNEGLVLKAAGRKADAARAFENALIVDPNLASALWNLSDLLFEHPASQDRSDTLLAHAFASGLPEGTKFLVGRAIGYQRAGQVGRSISLLRAGVALRAGEPDPWLFLGRYEVEAGDCPRAVSDLEQAARLTPKDAKVFASLGLARLCAGDRAAARRDLRHSLQLDPEQPPVREYLRSLGG